MQQAKPLFWFSHKEEKSDTSKDVSLFIWAANPRSSFPRFVTA
ncbi:hypothetical protein C7S15_3022 [Burkholderia cepacia]|nr:hypothetical protein [Burkholderia cepacia]